MKSKIVFQINVPGYGRSDKLTAFTYIQEMYEISERNAKRYAEKCGADYYKVEVADDFKLAAHKHLDYQKLKAYDFIDYDQIVYFDSDYIIKDNAPNLFEICGDKFSVCRDPGKAVLALANDLKIPIERYFNAGFMYLTKEVLNKSKDSLVKYLANDYSYEGQGMLNKMFFDLDINFNPLPASDWNPVNRCFGTYADHYAGAKKRNWGKVKY
jgi:lipopolysaccharide biosynthesis glycosyltransferase